MATSDPIAEIIGDYRAFAAMQRDRLTARGIDIAPLRHAPEGQCHEDRDQQPPAADDDNNHPGNLHMSIMSRSS